MLEAARTSSPQPSTEPPCLYLYHAQGYLLVFTSKCLVWLLPVFFRLPGPLTLPSGMAAVPSWFQRARAGATGPQGIRGPTKLNQEITMLTSPTTYKHFKHL